MRVDQLKRAYEMAKTYPRIVTADDTDLAFLIQAMPDSPSLASFAAATIAFVQGGAMTVLVDAAAPTGVNAIGTAGVIDTSAGDFDTVGEIVDYFNRPPYRAYVHAALRADTMATILAKGAASCIGANGLAFFSDTSASGTRSVCFSGEHFENNGKNGHKKDFEDAVENFISQIDINLDMTDNGTLTLYSGKQGVAESIIHGPVTLTDASAFQKNLDGLVGTFYKAAKRGERLILRCANDAGEMGSISQFHCAGRSAVGNLSRIEDGSFLP